ncbi:MAG: HAMP domain-containing sensor histidine kinase [Campylobacterota bacterium]|nr:HAMP domain-containing sensor histidine kinase [Campylobacterota bacterium]
MFFSNFKFKIFSAFIIVNISLTLFVMFNITKALEEQDKIEKNKIVKELLIKKEKQISIYINSFENILYSINENKYIKDSIIKNINKRNIEEFFKTLVKSNSNISQFRYLNNSGLEKIKIVSKSSKVEALFSNHLCDKSQRYYYKEIIKLNNNEIIYSKIDLNIENGEIEIPHNLVFRVAIKLDYGIFIINATTKPILNIIKDTEYKTCMLDENCYMILSKNNKNTNDIKNINKEENNSFTTRKLSANIMGNPILIMHYPSNIHEKVQKKFLNIFIEIFIYCIILSIVLTYIFSKPLIASNKELNDLVNKKTKHLKSLAKSLKKQIKKEVEKNTEQLLLIEQDKLKNAKLTSIGTLAAGITHEINTPLTYIKGNFEMLKYDIEDLPETIESKKYINENIIDINDGILRIENIIHAMREVSQTTTGLKEVVKVCDTLLTSLTITNNNSKQISKIYLKGKLFDLHYKCENNAFYSYVQKQRIEQVWIVMINNALDELIKMDNFENRVLKIDINTDNQYNIIKFHDNAGGIKENMLDKIFDPFISTKESSGIGIGLHIANKIINEHDGKIDVYNETMLYNDIEYMGAVFEIKLKIENGDKV